MWATRLPWPWLVLGVVLASIPAWLMFAWVVTGDVLYYRPETVWAGRLRAMTFWLSKRSGLTVAATLVLVWLFTVLVYLS